MLGRRTTFALASLALVLLAREASAVCTAVSACLFAHVAHCCTATTCTFDGPITIAPSSPNSTCTFDFGARDVTVKSGGEFRIGSNSVIIQAQSLHLTGNGKLLATGRAAAGGMPGTAGGSLTIETTGAFSLESPNAAIDVSGTNAGSLDIHAGGVVTVAGDSSKVNLRADGFDASDAGDIAITSGAAMTLSPAAVISAQGNNGGTVKLDAAADLMLDSWTRIYADKTGAGPGFAGSINIVAASIDARGIIEANNGQGDITLEARTGSLTLLHRPFGLSVDGGTDRDAGIITLLTDSLTDPDAMPPTNGLILIAAPLSAEGPAGTAGGGAVEVHAAGKLVVNERISVNGREQGSAGVLLEAAGDVELNSTITGTDTFQGAEIDIASGRHLVVNGTISAAGRASSAGSGGIITINAHNDLTLNAGSLLDVSGASSEDGGEIELSAGHDLRIQGGAPPAKLNANGGSLGGLGGSIDISAGDPLLTGDLTVAGEITAGDEGSVDLSGCALEVSGKVESTSAPHALNRLTARTLATVKSTARLRADVNEIVHLPMGLTDPEPGAVIAPAFSASEKPPCTGLAGLPNCLIPCTCGDSNMDPWEDCDDPDDPCGCNNCRRDCGDPGNPCQQSQCSPDGGCLRDRMPDGTPCGGSNCPALKTCQNGECVPGSSACGACCDDGDSCTQDLCLTDGCASGDIAGCCNDTHPCPPCTLCSDGSCVPIPNCCQPGDTCDDQNPCTTDACVDMAGDMVCSHALLSGPQPGCGGSCEPGLAARACHVTGQTSVCESTASCDDGDVCTVDFPDADGCCHREAISSCCHSNADCPSACYKCTTATGICEEIHPNCCLPGDPCDDEKPCTLDACVDTRCTHTDLPNGPQPGCGAGCGIAAKQCRNGACQTTAPCPDDDTPCTEPVRVDSSTGCCVYQPIDGCCDDPGDCGPCVRCDLPTLTCPTDSLPGCRECSSNLDCDPSADSDRGRCGEGVCDLAKGECQANTPPICLDGDFNTADTCIPDFAANDAHCVNTCLNDAPCDNGNACDGRETCAAGACRPGTALDCNDHNRCTDDSCDAAKGCQNRSRTGVAAIICQLDTFELTFNAAPPDAMKTALRNRIRRMLGQARTKVNAAGAAERAGNNRTEGRMLKTASRQLAALAKFVARQKRIPQPLVGILADAARGAADTASKLRASLI